jgi:hypothetical protein
MLSKASPNIQVQQSHAGLVINDPALLSSRAAGKRSRNPELFSDRFSEMTPEPISDMPVRGFLIANYRKFYCPGSTYSDTGFQTFWFLDQESNNYPYHA